MTENQIKKELNKIEKKPTHSKKFIAWFIQQLFMCTMATTALVHQNDLGWPLASFMVGIIFMMGISTMYYLGKQAALDTAVRGFVAIGSTPKKLIPSKKSNEDENTV